MSKTIAIIGAGPGVGLAIARRFGKEGFNVALLGRNEAKLASLVAELRAENVTAEAFRADVMDTSGLTLALQKVINQYGAIDVLEYGPAPVMSIMRPVLQTDQEAATYQFAFNVLGAIAAVQTVLPEMQAKKDGAILFTTAISAQHPVDLTASFGIAAGAQLNYARLLHDKLQGDGIFAGIVSIAAWVASDAPESKAAAANFPPGLPIVSADDVAAKHWELYTGRKQCEAIVGDAEAILGILRM